jgi:hypothetical protein
MKTVASPQPTAMPDREKTVEKAFEQIGAISRRMRETYVAGV